MTLFMAKTCTHQTANLPALQVALFILCWQEAGVQLTLDPSAKTFRIGPMGQLQMANVDTKFVLIGLR